MMDPAVRDFFNERKDAWLKKNTNAKMSDQELKDKQQEGDALFSREVWLPKAAKKAESRAFSSHPSKFSHPSTGVGDKNRKNKTYVTPIISKPSSLPDGYVRSGNVAAKLDSIGNAAALDVDEFLTLTMTDGESLLSHLQADSTLAKKIFTVDSVSYDDLRAEFLAMAKESVEPVTSSKVKQVYFPVLGGYHLLSILMPSGIFFEMRKRLDRLRFGEEVDGVNLLKLAKERRKNNEFHEQGYSEIYGLTTIGFGGTKPQNISVLNNKNGGKGHLLLSAPPQLRKRDIRFPTKDFFSQTVHYLQCKDLFNRLHKLYETSNNNRYIRKARDAYYDEIVAHIINKMWQIREISNEQYVSATNQLPSDQKIWLLEENQSVRESEDEWLNSIEGAIIRFIFHGYEKILAKKAVKLGDGEYDHIKTIVSQHREALR